jgi:hypothetical protein
MLKLTCICDSCGIEHTMRSVSDEDLFDKLSRGELLGDGWVETPKGNFYCAGCKFKHGAELAKEDL